MTFVKLLNEHNCYFLGKRILQQKFLYFILFRQKQGKIKKVIAFLI